MRQKDVKVRENIRSGSVDLVRRHRVARPLGKAVVQLFLLSLILLPVTARGQDDTADMAAKARAILANPDHRLSSSLSQSQEAVGTPSVDDNVYDARQMLFGVADEVPGARIGWYFDALKAYAAGIEQQHPIVFVFGASWCYYCGELVKSLTCPMVNTLAGDAVFAIVEADLDHAGTMLMDKLGVAAYPTISIISPRSDVINELARMNGYFTGEQLAGHLYDILGLHMSTGDLLDASLKYPSKIGLDNDACIKGTLNK